MIATGIKKVLLAQMAEFRAQFLRNGKMIVDDQADSSPLGHGQNRFSQTANFCDRQFLGAQLNQVGTPIAKLLGHALRRAPAQEGGIHKGVKPAFR